MFQRKRLIQAGVALLTIDFVHTVYRMIPVFQAAMDGASEEQIQQQASAAIRLTLSPPFIAM